MIRTQRTSDHSFVPRLFLVCKEVLDNEPWYEADSGTTHSPQNDPPLVVGCSCH